MNIYNAHALMAAKHPVTFKTAFSLFGKTKYIALTESVYVNDVLNKAIHEFVERWEAKNGKIDEKAWRDLVEAVPKTRKLNQIKNI